MTLSDRELKAYGKVHVQIVHIVCRYMIHHCKEKQQIKEK